MLKDSFEGKIIRVDGLNKESLSCKIFYNTRLKEEYNPITQQKSIQLSGQGQYTFMFTSGDQSKYLTLKLSLFSDDGAQWLPLFDSNELILNLPEETTSPRFLMVLCKSKNLHIIEESGEISEDSSLSVSESEENPLSQRVETEGQTVNTQEFLESIGSEFLDQSSIHEDNPEEVTPVPNSEKLSRIWDKDNSALSENFERNSFELFREESSIRGAYDDLFFKYQDLLGVSETNNKKVQDYEETFVKLVENFKDQVKRSQDREESLIQLVHEKEIEAKVAQEEIVCLRCSNQKLEIENLRLREINSGLLKEVEILSPSILLNEVQKLRTLVEVLQGRLVKLEKIEEYEAKIYEKDSIIHTLQKTLNRNKPSDSDTKESQNVSISIIDELDEAVRAHSKAMNLPEPPIKDREQMYIYGNRKISLMIVNGSLMCRIGGSFKPFKEYMENFVLDTPVVRPLRKRFSVEQGIDSEYDAENFKEALNKSVKLTPKTNRTPVLKRKSKP
jgi:hypothetical protein